MMIFFNYNDVWYANHSYYVNSVIAIFWLCANVLVILHIGTQLKYGIIFTADDVPISSIVFSELFSNDS